MVERREQAQQGVPRFWRTFIDTAPDLDPAKARVALVPVPYDSTTSYRSSARDGPKAIIEASRQLEDYDIELDRDISGVGIYTSPAVEPDLSGPEAMVKRVAAAVRPLADGGRLVGVLGGEHSITVGAVNALRARYDDLSVLYLDAHGDLRDQDMGTGWGHATVARRLHDICKTVHVGVRSLSAEEHRFIREEDLDVVMWPPQTTGPAELASRVTGSLTENVYISIDLDVFDPSIMAAVGTPEPGGMLWDEAIVLLRAVAAERKVVGFDVVELSPNEGPEACAFTAAKLVYKLIGYATDGEANKQNVKQAAPTKRE